MNTKQSFSRRELLKGGLAAGAALSFANIMGFIDYRRAHAQSEPINAAMSSAGLAGSWNAQGQDAALYWANLLGVNVTWFDGEFDPVKQRAKFDKIATQKWDFIAVQPNTIGTLVEPIQALIDRWYALHRYGYAGRAAGSNAADGLPDLYCPQ